MPKQKKDNFKMGKSIRYALKILFKERPLTMLTLLIMRLILAASFAVSVFVFAKLIGELVLIGHSNFNLNQTMLYFGIWIGIMTYQKLDEMILSHVTTRLRIFFMEFLRKQQVEKINNIKYVTLATAEFEMKQRQAMQGIAGLIDIVNNFFDIIEGIATCISTAIVLISFHYSLPLLLIAAAIPIFWLNLRLRKLEYTKEYYNIKDERSLWAYSGMFESKTSLPEIRNYNSSNVFVDRWKEFNESRNERVLGLNINKAKYNFFQTFIDTVFVIGIILFGVWLTVNGHMLLGQFVASIAAVRQFSGSTDRIASEVGWLYGRAKRMHDYIAFMELDEEHRGTVVLEGFNKEIIIKNAVFKYPKAKDKDEAPNILKNLTLTIKKGERIAIVGANGSGKTTLLLVLLGLLELESGEFTIDGIPFKDIELNSMKSLLSIVHQRYARYNALTVRENVALANVSYISDDKKLVTSLDKAEVTKAANEDLTENLDKRVGRDFEGYEFSGGEWQKLAICRSFFKNEAKIYVMDEPTSNLDAIVEEKVLNNFLTETEGKTAIIISHRLSLCKKADKIAFIDDGKVTEYGSHQELIKLNGKYADMFKNQEKWYKD